MSTDQPTVADSKRALLAIHHHQDGSVDGINAVFKEAAEARRFGQLFNQILDCYQKLVDQLVTDLGQKAMGELLGDLAHDPGVEDDVRNGARLIIGSAGSDRRALTSVLYDDKPSLSSLLVGVMNVHILLAPMIRTRVGRQIIDDAILAIAEQQWSSE